jgi:hypothetical protein
LLILFLSMVITWLLSPVSVDEPVPATIKTYDQVFVATAAGAAGTPVRRLQVVNPGSFIQVPDGSEVFLFMQGGVISRLEGPPEAQLVESRRSIDAPSALQAILAQRSGEDPTGKTKTESSLKLELLSGTMVLKGFTSRPNYLFSIKAGNMYAGPEGSAFQVSIRPDGEIWWDTLEGQPVVGMVSGPQAGESPVVVPTAPAGRRLAVPAVSPASKATQAFNKLLASMTTMVDAQRAGSGIFEAGGISYGATTDVTGITYLSGVVPVPATSEPQETFASESVEAPAVEDALAIPGLEVRLTTDADLQALLPPGMEVHIMPGNLVRITLRGVPYTVRLDAVGGRLELQGLPLGLDPSGYLKDLPALLSVETDEGVARSYYLPEEEAPPAATTASQITEQKALPHSNPYFSSNPTPLQVSLDWRVAAGNFILIVWLGLVVRVCITTSTNIIGANETLVKKYLNPVINFFQPVVKFLQSLVTHGPKALIVFTGSFLFLMLVNALLFSFLDVRFKPWSGDGLRVFPVVLLGTVTASMIDPIVRAHVMTKWGIKHNFGFNPGGLTLATCCVAFSRMVSLSPGILFGSSGGLKGAMDGQSEERKTTLLVIGMAATAVLGGTVWLITLAMPLVPSYSLSASFFQLFRGPFGFFQDVCLMSFTGCLTKTFFSLLPVPKSPGLTVASRYRVGWAIAFLVSGFLFFHLILNKNTGIVKLIQDRGG